MHTHTPAWRTRWYMRLTQGLTNSRHSAGPMMRPDWLPQSSPK